MLDTKRGRFVAVVLRNGRSHRLQHDCGNLVWQSSVTLLTPDRFLIIDKSTLVHVGASLNHLGKKCFAFSSLDKSNIPDILSKL